MNRHQFKLPRNTLLFRCLASILSCHLLLALRRFLMKFLPFMRLQSQVSNIVYLSWLVDIEQVRPHYPGIKLWEKQGKTIFTILTYQHRHFGFSFLGRFRKWMPSPKQSNWRFYLNESYPKTVLFEQVLLDQYIYVVGGRLASDVMPAQYPLVFQHHYDAQHQQIETDIWLDQSYHLTSRVQCVADKLWPASWQNLFSSWDEAVHFLVDQDHAWAQWVDQPDRMSQGDIEMPFQFQQIQAAHVTNLNIPSLLKQFGLDEQTEVFSFVVPQLDFHVVDEQILPKTQ